MGRSRRRAKKGKTKVQVGLPTKRRGTNKLPKAQTLILPSKETIEWNVDGTLTSNYSAAGFALDSNATIGSGTRAAARAGSGSESDGAGEGDPEEQWEEEPEELQVTLGKRRKGGAPAPRVERLTRMQRTHVLHLMERHGLDYRAMARDLKLNRMQQTAGALKFLCARYLAYDKPPPGVALPVPEAGGA